MSEPVVEISSYEEAKKDLDYSEALYLFARASGVSTQDQFDTLVFELCRSIPGASREALPSESAIRAAEVRTLGSQALLNVGSAGCVDVYTVTEQPKKRMGRIPC